MAWRIEPLTPDRVNDFDAYHCDANDAGWCHCVAWWVPTWDGWGDRRAAENRALRDQLFDQGHFDGYLAYDDSADGYTPVGWCQVGRRDRLTKLVDQYNLTPDPSVWAVTCFNIAPSHRRSGVARSLLARVLDDLRALGVPRVEAFPRRATEGSPGALWTGPETLYLDAGFRVDHDDDARPVLSLDLGVVDPVEDDS